MTLLLPAEELQVQIRKEVNETLESRASDLETIKNWLRQQPHLPDNYDDTRLLNFLRGVKFSLERCKKKLELYFIKRATQPRFFKDRDVRRPELNSLPTMFYGAYLPKLTHDGKRIGVGGILQSGLLDIPMANIIKILFMAGDVRLNEEKYGVAGEIYVIDTSKVFAKQLLRIPLDVVREFFQCLQAYPAMIKEIHLINVSPLVVRAIQVIKPFVKEKLFNRIRIHTTRDTLYTFVPRDVLPEEFGGSAGKMDSFVCDWMKKLEEYREFFRNEENYVADMSKRPPDCLYQVDIYGVEGSFRKLMVD